MLVYIINSESDEENCYATLDKEIAKQLIKDEILNAESDEKFDEEEIEAFAQDLVDGNTKIAIAMSLMVSLFVVIY